MSETRYGRYTFTVKEYADGTPWIMAELFEGPDVFEGNKYLGFTLPEGTTYEEAKIIAKNMNSNLVRLSITSF